MAPCIGAAAAHRRDFIMLPRLPQRCRRRARRRGAGDAAGGRARRGAAHPRRRARRLGAARELQPVDLADHGVARHAFAEHSGDLAGAQALQPKFLEQLDALFSPAHQSQLLTAFRRCRLLHRAVASVQTARYATHRRSEGSATRDIVSQCLDTTRGAESGSRVGAEFSRGKHRRQFDLPEAESNQALGPPTLTL